MNENSKRSGKGWVIGISVVLGATILFSLGAVFFAVNRTEDLVSPRYYAEGIAYNNKMERAGRGAVVADSIHLQFIKPAKTIVLFAPTTLIGAEGTIMLYRPSWARSDRVLPLAVDSTGKQFISTETLPPGKWIVKLEYSLGDSAYYNEQLLVTE